MQRYSNLAKLPSFGHITPVPRPATPPPRVHQASRRLGDDAVAQLVADYQAGVPTTQLTGRYGIGKGTVLGLLTANGVLRRRQPMSPSDIAHAAELYAAGWSLNAIGRELGRDHTVIRYALQRLKPPGPPCHG